MVCPRVGHTCAGSGKCLRCSLRFCAARRQAKRLARAFERQRYKQLVPQELHASLVYSLFVPAELFAATALLVQIIQSIFEPGAEPQSANALRLFHPTPLSYSPVSTTVAGGLEGRPCNRSGAEGEGEMTIRPLLFLPQFVFRQVHTPRMHRQKPATSRWCRSGRKNRWAATLLRTT